METPSPFNKVTKKITAKLAVASQLALRAHQYQYSSFVFLTSGVSFLLYRIYSAFSGDETLFSFFCGVILIGMGWLCYRMSGSYLEDLKHFKR